MIGLQVVEHFVWQAVFSFRYFDYVAERGRVSVIGNFWMLKLWKSLTQNNVFCVTPSPYNFLKKTLMISAIQTARVRCALPISKNINKNRFTVIEVAL